MDIPTSLVDVSKVFSSLSAKLQLPVVFLTAVLRRFLLQIVNLVGAIANTVAILVCYVYLKNFRRHSIVIVDGYITIFKTFAEFISAVVCLCFGIMEVDFFYTVLGALGIATGLFLKALLLYGEHHGPNGALNALARCFCALYVVCVLVCGFAFHAAATSIGAIPCVARIVTCVVPLVALSEFFRVSGRLGRCFAYLADLVAVSVLWWHCANLSLKYFVLVPSVVGLVFSFIQYVLVEIQKVTSKEIESDIYRRE